MKLTLPSRSRLFMAGALVLIALLELLLAFRGPIALTRTPSLMLMPIRIQSAELSPEQLDTLTVSLEAAFAGPGNASVKPQGLIAEYLFPKGRTLDEASDLEGALLLGNELGIQRVAEATLAGWGGDLTLYLTLFDSATGSRIASGTFSGADLSALEATLNGPEFAQTFALETPGFTPFDLSFFLLLALEILLALLLLIGNERLANQGLIIFGSTLYLFALFFARNANMDYVQRFVAQGGALKLAADTARQQLEVSIRFLPLLLPNLILYFWGGPRPLSSKGPGRAVHSNSSLLRSSGISTAIPAAFRGMLHQPPGLLVGWLSGVLYAFAFPSLIRLEGIAWLSLFALIPLLLYIRTAGRGDAAMSIMAFASLQVMLINFWHSTYSYVSLPFTVLLSLSQWLIFLPFLLFFSRRAGRSWLLLTPAVWVLFDWLRGMGFLAYPWGMLGTAVYPWIPFIQAASLTGVWGLSWLLIFINAAGAEALLNWKRRRLPLLGLAAALALPLLFGLFSLTLAPESAKSARLVLVQHNRDPRKHDYAESLDALLRLSEEGIAASLADGVKPDLVVWPETAFVPDIRYWMRPGNAGRSRRLLAEKLFAAAERWGIPLVTGTSDHTRLAGESDTTYPGISHNSTVLIEPVGKEDAGAAIASIYHKIVLVPFTEYFPFKEELPQVYAQLDKFDVSDWTPGSDYDLHRIPGFAFGTPICFEDIMPGHIRNFAVAGAGMIVNVSNDYWSLSPVEGMQHGVNGLFRAVENRLPLVRATTSGLTMGVDPWGRILKRLGFFEEGALVVDLPLLSNAGNSFYARFGDWFPLLMLILLSLEFVRRLTRSRMS